MNNSVIPEADGLLVLAYHGPQSYKSIFTMNSKADAVIVSLRKKHTSVRILLNLMQSDLTARSVRKISTQTLRSLDYDKMAVCGRDTFTKVLLSFIITATGKESKAKFFMNEADARAWVNR
jgi:hypothetical protein